MLFYLFPYLCSVPFFTRPRNKCSRHSGLDFGICFAQMSVQIHPLFLMFVAPAPQSVFWGVPCRILTPYWLFTGSTLAAFGLLAQIWLPSSNIWAAFRLIFWGPFCRPLAPSWRSVVNGIRQSSSTNRVMHVLAGPQLCYAEDIN